MTHESYIDLVSTMADTFLLDFESTNPLHSGFVSLSEVTSSIYLAGLNRCEFRRAIDKLLQNHSTGRLPDPFALMAQLQSWKGASSHSFTRGAVSTQGCALVAAKIIPSRSHRGF